MIRALWRYTRLACAAVAALLVLAGRELHPVLVGGFTKADPRHPAQVRRRIALMEHAALPGPYEHDPAECEQCDPEKRRELAKQQPSPRADSWVCTVCGQTGMSALVWQRHWVETSHEDWHEYDEWRDAYRESMQIRTAIDVARARLANEIAALDRQEPA